MAASGVLTRHWFATVKGFTLQIRPVPHNTTTNPPTMAGRRLLAVAEFVENVLLDADVNTIVVACRTHPVLRNAVRGPLALRRKLLLLPRNDPQQIWRYIERPPLSLWHLHPNYEDVVRVGAADSDHEFRTFFDIKTPNPMLLQHTHLPEEYAEILDEIVPTPKYQSTLVAIGGAHERHFRSSRNAIIPGTVTRWQQDHEDVYLHAGIDRLDIATKFFPAAMDRDSIYYHMLLFEELTTKVMILWQLNDGEVGGEWAKGKRLVKNPGGVRMETPWRR